MALALASTELAIALITCLFALLAAVLIRLLYDPSVRVSWLEYIILYGFLLAVLVFVATMKRCHEPFSESESAVPAVEQASFATLLQKLAQIPGETQKRIVGGLDYVINNFNGDSDSKEEEDTTVLRDDEMPRSAILDYMRGDYVLRMLKEGDPARYAMWMAAFKK